MMTSHCVELKHSLWNQGKNGSIKLLNIRLAKSVRGLVFTIEKDEMKMMSFKYPLSNEVGVSICSIEQTENHFMQNQIKRLVTRFYD